MKKYTKNKSSGIDWLGDIPEHWEVKRVKEPYEILYRMLVSSLALNRLLPFSLL